MNVNITTSGQVFTGVSEATAAVLSRVFGSAAVLTESMAPAGCTVTVKVTAGRYPYRPECTCGHTFRGYVAQHAAQVVADDHASK